MATAKVKLTREEVLRLCAESVTVALVPTGADAFGINHNAAYTLAQAGAFPCKVIRVGNLWRILSVDLLRCLGLDEPE